MVCDVLCKSEWPIVVVATTSSPKLITPDLHSGFLHQYSIKVHFTIIERFEIRIMEYFGAHALGSGVHCSWTVYKLGRFQMKTLESR